MSDCPSGCRSNAPGLDTFSSRSGAEREGKLCPKERTSPFGKCPGVVRAETQSSMVRYIRGGLKATLALTGAARYHLVHPPSCNSLGAAAADFRCSLTLRKSAFALTQAASDLRSRLLCIRMGDRPGTRLFSAKRVARWRMLDSSSAGTR
jgi:hypothetical protein